MGHLDQWAREYLLRRVARSDDPEVEARRLEILQAVLEARPQVKEKLIKTGIEEGIKQGFEKGIEKGELGALRSTLVRVLAWRQLAVTAAQGAQIEQCADTAALARWIDQAMTAATADAALR